MICFIYAETDFYSLAQGGAAAGGPFLAPGDRDLGGFPGGPASVRAVPGTGQAPEKGIAGISGARGRARLLCPPPAGQ